MFVKMKDFETVIQAWDKIISHLFWSSLDLYIQVLIKQNQQGLGDSKDTVDFQDENLECVKKLHDILSFASACFGPLRRSKSPPGPFDVPQKTDRKDLTDPDETWFCAGIGTRENEDVDKMRKHVYRLDTSPHSSHADHSEKSEYSPKNLESLLQAGNKIVAEGKHSNFIKDLLSPKSNFKSLTRQAPQRIHFIYTLYNQSHGATGNPSNNSEHSGQSPGQVLPNATSNSPGTAQRSTTEQLHPVVSQLFHNASQLQPSVSQMQRNFGNFLREPYQNQLPNHHNQAVDNADLNGAQNSVKLQNNPMSLALARPNSLTHQKVQMMNQPTQRMNQPTQRMIQPTQRMIQPTQRMNQPFPMMNQSIQRMTQPSQGTNQQAQMMNQPTERMNQPAAQRINQPAQMMNQPVQMMNQAARLMNLQAQIINQRPQGMNQHAQPMNQQVHNSALPSQMQRNGVRQPLSQNSDFHTRQIRPRFPHIPPQDEMIEMKTRNIFLGRVQDPEHNHIVRYSPNRIGYRSPSQQGRSDLHPQPQLSTSSPCQTSVRTETMMPCDHRSLIWKQQLATPPSLGQPAASPLQGQNSTSQQRSVASSIHGFQGASSKNKENPYAFEELEGEKIKMDSSYGIIKEYENMYGEKIVKYVFKEAQSLMANLIFYNTSIKLTYFIDELKGRDVPEGHGFQAWFVDRIMKVFNVNPQLASLIHSSLGYKRMIGFVIGRHSLESFALRFPSWCNKSTGELKEFAFKIEKVVTLAFISRSIRKDRESQRPEGAQEASSEEEIPNLICGYHSIIPYVINDPYPQARQDIRKPPHSMQGMVNSILNSLDYSDITPSDIQQKASMLRTIVMPNFVGWMSQYLVLVHIASIPTSHRVISKLIDAMYISFFAELVMKEVIFNIKNFLHNGASRDAQNLERLQNLGRWLGLQTIAKGEPQKMDLNLKELLFEAYYMDITELRIVLSFVASILSASSSEAFDNPTPWTVSLLNVLTELHEDPDMPQDLKHGLDELFYKFNVANINFQKQSLIHDQERISKLKIWLLPGISEQDFLSKTEEMPEEKKINSIQPRHSTRNGSEATDEKESSVTDNPGPGAAASLPMKPSDENNGAPIPAVNEKNSGEADCDNLDLLPTNSAQSLFIEWNGRLLFMDPRFRAFKLSRNNAIRLNTFKEFTKKNKNLAWDMDTGLWTGVVQDMSCSLGSLLWGTTIGEINIRNTMVSPEFFLLSQNSGSENSDSSAMKDAQNEKEKFPQIEKIKEYDAIENSERSFNACPFAEKKPRQIIMLASLFCEEIAEGNWLKSLSSKHLHLLWSNQCEEDGAKESLPEKFIPLFSKWDDLLPCEIQIKDDENQNSSQNSMCPLGDQPNELLTLTNMVEEIIKESQGESPETLVNIDENTIAAQSSQESAHLTDYKLYELFPMIYQAESVDPPTDEKIEKFPLSNKYEENPAKESPQKLIDPAAKENREFPLPNKYEEGIAKLSVHESIDPPADKENEEFPLLERYKEKIAQENPHKSVDPPADKQNEEFPLSQRCEENIAQESPHESGDSPADKQNVLEFPLPERYEDSITQESSHESVDPPADKWNEEFPPLKRRDENIAQESSHESVDPPADKWNEEFPPLKRRDEKIAQESPHESVDPPADKWNEEFPLLERRDENIAQESSHESVDPPADKWNEEFPLLKRRDENIAQESSHESVDPPADKWNEEFPLLERRDENIAQESLHESVDPPENKQKEEFPLSIVQESPHESVDPPENKQKEEFPLSNDCDDSIVQESPDESVDPPADKQKEEFPLSNDYEENIAQESPHESVDPQADKQDEEFLLSEKCEENITQGSPYESVDPPENKHKEEFPRSNDCEENITQENPHESVDPPTNKQKEEFPRPNDCEEDITQESPHESVDPPEKKQKEEFPRPNDCDDSLVQESPHESVDPAADKQKEEFPLSNDYEQNITQESSHESIDPTEDKQKEGFPLTESHEENIAQESPHESVDPPADKQKEDFPLTECREENVAQESPHISVDPPADKQNEKYSLSKRDEENTAREAAHESFQSFADEQSNQPTRANQSTEDTGSNHPHEPVDSEDKKEMLTPPFTISENPTTVAQHGESIHLTVDQEPLDKSTNTKDQEMKNPCTEVTGNFQKLLPETDIIQEKNIDEQHTAKISQTDLGNQDKDLETVSTVKKNDDVINETDVFQSDNNSIKGNIKIEISHNPEISNESGCETLKPEGKSQTSHKSKKKKSKKKKKKSNKNVTQAPIANKGDALKASENALKPEGNTKRENPSSSTSLNEDSNQTFTNLGKEKISPQRTVSSPDTSTDENTVIGKTAMEESARIQQNSNKTDKSPPSKGNTVIDKTATEESAKFQQNSNKIDNEPPSKENDVIVKTPMEKSTRSQQNSAKIDNKPSSKGKKGVKLGKSNKIVEDQCREIEKTCLRSEVDNGGDLSTFEDEKRRQSCKTEETVVDRISFNYSTDDEGDQERMKIKGDSEREDELQKQSAWDVDTGEDGAVGNLPCPEMDGAVSNLPCPDLALDDLSLEKMKDVLKELISEISLLNLKDDQNSEVRPKETFEFLVGFLEKREFQLKPQCCDNKSEDGTSCVCRDLLKYYLNRMQRATKDKPGMGFCHRLMKMAQRVTSEEEFIVEIVCNLLRLFIDPGATGLSLDEEFCKYDVAIRAMEMLTDDEIQNLNSFTDDSSLEGSESDSESTSGSIENSQSSLREDGQWGSLDETLECKSSLMEPESDEEARKRFSVSDDQFVLSLTEDVKKSYYERKNAEDANLDPNQGNNSAIRDEFTFSSCTDSNRVQLMMDIMNDWADICRGNCLESYKPLKASAIPIIQQINRLSPTLQEGFLDFLYVMIKMFIVQFHDDWKDVNIEVSESDKEYPELDGLGLLAGMTILSVEEEEIVKVFIFQIFTIIRTLLIRNHDSDEDDFHPIIYYRIVFTFLETIYSGETRRKTDKDFFMWQFCYFLMATLPERAPRFAYMWSTLLSSVSFRKHFTRTRRDRQLWDIYAELLGKLFLLVALGMEQSMNQHLWEHCFQTATSALIHLRDEMPQFLCLNSNFFCCILSSCCEHLRKVILCVSPPNLSVPDPLNVKYDINKAANYDLQFFLELDFEKQYYRFPGPIEADLISFLEKGTPKTITNRLKNLMINTKAKKNKPGYRLAIMNTLTHAVGCHAVTQLFAKQNAPDVCPHLSFFQKLLKELKGDGAFMLVITMLNQLRYPSSLTIYFGVLVITLYRTSDIPLKELIVRALSERFILEPPYPWGVLWTVGHMMKNRDFSQHERKLQDCKTELARLKQKFKASTTTPLPSKGTRGFTKDKSTLTVKRPK